MVEAALFFAPVGVTLLGLLLLALWAVVDLMRIRRAAKHLRDLSTRGRSIPEVVVADKPSVRSASYLSPPDFHRLNWACMPIAHAFGEPPYLVGSVLTRPDFRDIDIRLILDDEAVERMFNTNGELFDEGEPDRVRLLFNIALSDLIQKAANPPRPIDFQIQSMTEANVPEHGARNPLGIRR